MTAMRGLGLGATACLTIALASGTAQAHFILHQPASMTNQSVLGDPQKQPPCGDNSGTMLTGETTAFTAGETITIQIEETVYHPGHYRVALALDDPNDLPANPPVTPVEGDQCGSTDVMDPPVFPVLADGELAHSEMFGGPQTFTVTLPDDVECDACILQVIEYMSSHGAPCFYHHCAEISIEASASATSNGDDSTGDSSPASTGNGDGTSSDDSNDDNGSDPTNASNADSDDETSSPSTATATATATDTDSSTGPDETGDGGCGCRSTHAPAGTIAAGFGLLLLLRRRPRAPAR